ARKHEHRRSRRADRLRASHLEQPERRIHIDLPPQFIIELRRSAGDTGQMEHHIHRCIEGSGQKPGIGNAAGPATHTWRLGAFEADVHECQTPYRAETCGEPGGVTQKTAGQRSADEAIRTGYQYIHVLLRAQGRSMMERLSRWRKSNLLMATIT